MADCPLPHLIAGGYITLYTGYDLWDLEGTIMKVWFIYLVLSGWEDSIHVHKDLPSGKHVHSYGK